jgi:hypothetical protein
MLGVAGSFDLTGGICGWGWERRTQRSLRLRKGRAKLGCAERSRWTFAKLLRCFRASMAFRFHCSGTILVPTVRYMILLP